jgi:hypothetical protein
VVATLAQERTASLFSDDHARFEIMLAINVGIAPRLIVGGIAVRGARRCFEKFLLIHLSVSVPKSMPCM